MSSSTASCRREALLNLAFLYQTAFQLEELGIKAAWLLEGWGFLGGAGKPKGSKQQLGAGRLTAWAQQAWSFVWQFNAGKAAENTGFLPLFLLLSFFRMSPSPLPFYFLYDSFLLVTAAKLFLFNFRNHFLDLNYQKTSKFLFFVPSLPSSYPKWVKLPFFLGYPTYISYININDFSLPL